MQDLPITVPSSFWADHSSVLGVDDLELVRVMDPVAYVGLVTRRQHVEGLTAARLAMDASLKALKAFEKVVGDCNDLDRQKADFERRRDDAARRMASGGRNGYRAPAYAPSPQVIVVDRPVDYSLAMADLGAYEARVQREQREADRRVEEAREAEERANRSTHHSHSSYGGGDSWGSSSSSSSFSSGSDSGGGGGSFSTGGDSW